jgi:hypothetical protein
MLTDAHKFNTGSNPFLGYASATPAQDLRAAAPTQMQLAVQAGQVLQQLHDHVEASYATPWRGLHIKPDFQPRIQFSASQLETASGCQYAWALRYIIGLKKPEPALETAEDEQRELARLPTLAKRDRSLTFGKLLHKRLERHYRGEAVDWTDDVGQRALTGLQYLPGLDEPRRIESAISLAKDSVIGGVDLPFVGFIDLETLPKTYDYKTTGDFRWMKKPHELRENLAAALYSVSSMQQLGLRQRDMRWVYFSSVGKPEARPCDFTITYDEAIPIVRSAFVQASGLKDLIVDYREQASKDCVSLERSHAHTQLTLIDHIPKNPSNCKAYGGCPYHYEAGGPCHPEPPSVTDYAAQLMNISEPKTTAAPSAPAERNNTMATLQERLAAISGQSAAAPVQQQPAQPFQGFSAPAPAPQQPQAAPVNFGAPQAPAEHLTGQAPVPQPFNPAGAGFPGAPSGQMTYQAQPATGPVPAGFGAPDLQQPPAAPVTQFAASSAPQAPAQAFPGFGPSPVQANTPVQPAPFFTGVNPPEAATAAALPVSSAPQHQGTVAAPAQAAPAETGKRKRRTQAEMQAARAGGEQPAVGAVTPDRGTIGDFDVSITITDTASGAVFTLPAPGAIAQQMIDALGPTLAGFR